VQAGGAPLSRVSVTRPFAIGALVQFWPEYVPLISFVLAEADPEYVGQKIVTEPPGGMGSNA
jgi:hypothetical protein